jgi:hypothetical protein
MILTTHAVVGAALASFVPSHPVTAFAMGFASHFVLDAIPRRLSDQVLFGESQDWGADGVR